MKKFRGIYLKNEKEIDHLRAANRIVATILDRLTEKVAPGVKTLEFEKVCLDSCQEFGVTPAFKGYLGYPFALCCSVNEQVVHGFPSERRLEEGDIVSFDMGVVYQGFFGDAARTVPVGPVAPEAARLLAVTEASLHKGIEQAVCGNNLYDISAAIQDYVEAQGFSVVRRFVGHGIGRNLHEKPEVPNFVPKGMPPIPLRAGMVLAIEPMVCMGGYDVEILADRWTAVTRDRKLSAHFEHSIALWPDGPEIMSISEPR